MTDPSQFDKDYRTVRNAAIFSILPSWVRITLLIWLILFLLSMVNGALHSAGSSWFGELGEIASMILMVVKVVIGVPLQLFGINIF